MRGKKRQQAVDERRADATRCSCCGTAMQGRAVYCVLCYAQLLRVCPNCCTVVNGRARLMPRSMWLNQVVPCPVCKGDRYYLATPEARQS